MICSNSGVAKHVIGCDGLEDLDIGGPGSYMGYEEACAYSCAGCFPYGEFPCTNLTWYGEDYACGGYVDC